VKKAEAVAKKPAAKKKSGGLTAEERAAMKETLRERKAEKNREEGENDLLTKIAEMPEPDRGMATRIHEIVKTNAPELSPKTWYGMPAYATKEGKIVCFFQTAQKFGARYATFGFNDSANLDEGSMWPTSYALTAMTATEEKRIIALVKKAVS
jgi:uncharacterized protein YdhG (YjbR/CyaY superfamily)